MSYTMDCYVLDTLMRDLVGYDRRPSAFLVYLSLLAACGQRGAALSYAQLADRTGLSKRAVQAAVVALERRGLLGVERNGATGVPRYQVLSPWVRPSP
jgi:DNA-binding MarR family transcriptional regulator